MSRTVRNTPTKHPKCHWTMKDGQLVEKRGFTTREAADNYADHEHKGYRLAGLVHTYRCSVCGKWHFATIDVQQERIDQHHREALEQKIRSRIVKITEQCMKIMDDLKHLKELSKQLNL